MKVYVVRVLTDIRKFYEGLGDVEIWTYSNKEMAINKLVQEYEEWRNNFIKDAGEYVDDISAGINIDKEADCFSFFVNDDNDYISGDILVTNLIED